MSFTSNASRSVACEENVLSLTVSSIDLYVTPNSLLAFPPSKTNTFRGSLASSTAPTFPEGMLGRLGA